MVWFLKEEEDSAKCEKKVRELNPQYFKKTTWQIERCPTSGRLHIQGFFMLRKPARLYLAKTYFKDNSIHLEKAKFSGAVETYSSKENTRISGPWEHVYEMTNSEESHTPSKENSSGNVQKESEQMAKTPLSVSIYKEFLSGINFSHSLEEKKERLKCHCLLAGRVDLLESLWGVYTTPLAKPPEGADLDKAIADAIESSTSKSRDGRAKTLDPVKISDAMHDRKIQENLGEMSEEESMRKIVKTMKWKEADFWEYDTQFPDHGLEKKAEYWRWLCQHQPEDLRDMIWQEKILPLLKTRLKREISDKADEKKGV